MARRANLRASDADREQIVDRLRRAAAEGRLAAHELEDRVGDALQARTYGELDATVLDLPTGSPARQRSGRSVLPWTVSTVRAHPIVLVAAIPVVVVTVALVAAIMMLSLACVTVLFLLGHRRAICRGPWMYVGRGGFGPLERIGRRAPEHWA